MATQKLNLTRDQLATFLKNHEQIKQFELLFQVADEVSAATDTQGISIQSGNADAAANSALAQIVTLAKDVAINAGNADNKAVQALDALDRIANALEMMATAPVIQNNNSVVTDYIDFTTTTPAPAVKVGRMHWNGGYTLNLEMTPNVNQSIGESQYYYIKASANIAKGQLVMFDGAVGSSGVLKGKPSTGLTNGQLVMGVAAEAIALNDFGLVSSFGLVRGFNTTGAPYGEVWADGDILYYNPSFAGGLTKNLPQAPTPHVVVAAVVNAGPAGSGSVFVRVQAEPLVSQLSDVYAPTPINGDVLVYDGVQQRWENVPTSTLPVGTATNLAGGVAGSVPYQTAPGATTFLPIGTALQVMKVNAGATAPEWVTGAALTKVDDTNVTLTLGGTPTTSLLAATSLTLGWTGQLATGRGGTGLSSYTAGDMVYYASGTALTKLAIGASGSYLSSSGTAPQWNAPGALTKVDDTNVTLTLGGNPTTALLNATSLTLGWTGQLSLSRGGTNANLTAAAGGVAYSTASALALNTPGSSGDWLKSSGAGAPAWTAPAALTKTDDTNVTLTLGGSASTALLNAASITVGWTGTLATGRGGTGLSSYTAGDMVYYASGTALTKLAIGIGNYVLTSNGSAPVWTANTGTGAVMRSSQPTVNTTLGVGGVGASSSGSGISFPATQDPSTDANTLDDYEENTWTPTVTSSSGTITSYTLVGANYTKIGRVVHVNFAVTITNAGTGAGSLDVTLPFTNGAVIANGSGRENALTGYQLQCRVNAGAASMSIQTYANATAIATNAQIRVSMTYFT